MICKLHGYPKSTIPGEILYYKTSFEKLFKLRGTKLRISIAYHQQIDGQMEVLNRGIQQNLRAFIHKNLLLEANSIIRRNGKIILQYIVLRDSHHSVVYSRPPSSIPQYIRGSSTFEAIDTSLRSKDEVMTCLQPNLGLK